jgi:hypothetical protein
MIRCARKELRVIAGFAITWMGHGQAWASCTEVALIAPVRGTTSAEIRPQLVWSPVAGSARYRVQIESRVPNGRVIARIDTQTSETTFTPQQPFAVGAVTVKARVLADCGAEEDSTVGEAPPWFFIDPRAACEPPREVAFRSAPAAALEWRLHPGTRTEVAVFFADGGQLIVREEVGGTRYAMAAATGPLIIGIRTHCKETYSGWLYRAVPAREG